MASLDLDLTVLGKSKEHEEAPNRINPPESASALWAKAMKSLDADSTSCLLSVIENCEDAIFMKTPQQKVIAWNRSAEKIFGVRAHEIMGRSFLTFVPMELKEEPADILNRLKRGERVEQYETVRLNKEGHRIYISQTVTPVKDGAGKIIALLTIARDVTKRRRLEEQLRRAHRDLQQRVADKNKELQDTQVAILRSQTMEAVGLLASNVAHEVRNPLNAIQVTAEALQQELSENQEQREMLGTIRSQVKRLSQIMQQLLEVGRPQPQTRLRREWLGEICASAVQVWKQANVDRARSVLLAMPEDVPFISADAERLHQALLNLLDNAAQHSPKESVISMELEKKKEFVEIRVTDRGKGISSKLAERFFEPFFTLREGGTGLGLTIVRQVVEEHSGQTFLRSNYPNPGATAIIRLPYIKETR